ncbi:MAG: TonB-dependent receptor [Proteobacteria bacterium]|nr:TonB-dependent receptor [Pseudomonadota bacterium]
MPSLSFFLCALLCGSPAFAEDIYEVTAPPLSEPIGGKETIISAKEIDTYQETFLKEALTYSPSVNLISNGPPGRQVDFSMRGARAPQNLVLVDGIYVNDPASGGGVDLANFLTADLDRVEVLPGPQSLAYGPGALGGVIQLIPKRGYGKPSVKVRGERGSFDTQYGTLTAQGEEGPLTFSATAAGLSRGPDPFTNPLHGNRQGDDYINGTFSSRLGYALTDNWEVEGIVRYVQGKVQFDGDKKVGNIFLPFEAQNFSNTQTLLTSLENKWGCEMWDHSLKASYAQTHRKTDTPSFHAFTTGEHPLLAYRSEFKINSQHTLLGGLEGGQELAKIPELYKRAHGGVFLIHTFKPFETTALKGGVRVDQYQALGSRVTFNIGADQKMTPSTTLRTSYGTNFKPPVLSDLFQQTPWQRPNPFLKPETSQSFEVGIDQVFCNDTIKASLTGFLTTIHNITLSRQMPGGSWQRFNGEERFTQGVEMAFSLKPLKTLEMKAALTLTHARDFPRNHKSPLIPSFKGAGELHWQALPDLSFFVQAYGVTEKKDSVTKQTLSPYGLVTIGGAYDVNPQASLFLRVENLGNTHYEDVFGYGVRGRAFFFGVEAKT